MGVLGWTPEQFWKSTRRDLDAAFAGWREANGCAPKKDRPTLADLDALEAQYPDE